MGVNCDPWQLQTFRGLRCCHCARRQGNIWADSWKQHACQVWLVDPCFQDVGESMLPKAAIRAHVSCPPILSDTSLNDLDTW